MSTYDTIDYDHNKVAVYRHDAHGVLRDVTGLKLFRSMEDLTLIDGEMMHGTYVTDGHRVRTIMTRQHMAMNERMVQQGIINNNVDDGVQCVDTPTPDIHATTLVDYEVLSRVMDKVMKQITARSKYSSELRDKLTKKRYENEQPLEEENEQMDVEVEEREEEDQTNTIAAAASVRLSY